MSYFDRLIQQSGLKPAPVSLEDAPDRMIADGAADLVEVEERVVSSDPDPAPPSPGAEIVTEFVEAPKTDAGDGQSVGRQEPSIEDRPPARERHSAAETPTEDKPPVSPSRSQVLSPQSMPRPQAPPADMDANPFTPEQRQQQLLRRVMAWVAAPPTAEGERAERVPAKDGGRPDEVRTAPTPGERPVGVDVEIAAGSPPPRVERPETTAPAKTTVAVKPAATSMQPDRREEATAKEKEEVVNISIGTISLQVKAPEAGRQTPPPAPPRPSAPLWQDRPAPSASGRLARRYLRV